MSCRPLSRPLRTLIPAFTAAVGRLDKSLSPRDNIMRFRRHHFTLSDSIYLFHIILAAFWLTIMKSPGFPLKLLIPTLYAIALLIPLTSQFFIPATPVFAWILTFYASRFIPDEYRPVVSVVILPTLESVMYGANISDILTRFTHPVLDIIAWIPYGVIHFILPFFVALFLWLFRPKQTLHLWARAFGYMNLVGVFIQIIFPCAAPWYELIYGLTPASYSTPGSAGGLGRIDKLFNSHGYDTTFSSSPVVFGAFPSLHAGCATIEALFLSHFFPQTTRIVWAYVCVLYWATMYLTHHYLIDVVGGACLATGCFYFFLPDELKGRESARSGTSASKYEVYDLEAPRKARGRSNGVPADAYDLDPSETSSQASDEEMDIGITYRSPVPGATPTTTTSFTAQQQQPQHHHHHPGTDNPGKVGGHRHTASIASLTRADERNSGEEGWASSPRAAGFVFSPTAAT
jgi:inositol phosphorylceramide synthase catalytic subunit